MKLSGRCHTGGVATETYRKRGPQGNGSRAAGEQEQCQKRGRGDKGKRAEERIRADMAREGKRETVNDDWQVATRRQIHTSESCWPASWSRHIGGGNG